MWRGAPHSGRMRRLLDAALSALPSVAPDAQLESTLASHYNATWFSDGSCVLEGDASFAANLNADVLRAALTRVGVRLDDTTRKSSVTLRSAVVLRDMTRDQAAWFIGPQPSVPQVVAACVSETLAVPAAAVQLEEGEWSADGWSARLSVSGFGNDMARVSDAVASLAIGAVAQEAWKELRPLLCADGRPCGPDGVSLSPPTVRVVWQLRRARLQPQRPFELPAPVPGVNTTQLGVNGSSLSGNATLLLNSSTAIVNDTRTTNVTLSGNGTSVVRRIRYITRRRYRNRRIISSPS